MELYAEAMAKLTEIMRGSDLCEARRAAANIAALCQAEARLKAAVTAPPIVIGTPSKG